MRRSSAAGKLPTLRALLYITLFLAGCSSAISGSLLLEETDEGRKVVATFQAEGGAAVDTSKLNLKFQVEGTELVFPDGPGASACIGMPQSLRLELATGGGLPPGSSVSAFVFEYEEPEEKSESASSSSLRVAQTEGAEGSASSKCTGKLIANASLVKPGAPDAGLVEDAGGDAGVDAGADADTGVVLVDSGVVDSGPADTGAFDGGLTDTGTISDAGS